MDVEGLYTNIRTEMGLEAVKTVMDESPDPTTYRLISSKLLHLSLNRTDLEFDLKFYLQ